MDKYVFDLIAFLVGTALVGLVALLINGLKTELHEIKAMLEKMVTEPLCKERMGVMEKGINGIGKIARGEK